MVTNPEYISKWWDPRQYTIEINKAEIHSGGQWRYIHHANGMSFGFHGVYHEVLDPKRVINTFEWEGLPEKGHVILETVKYEVLPESRTKLTIQQVF